MSEVTYKLIPLSGECGSQLVDGYADAREIAARIAREQQTDVLVFDAAGRAIVWSADGTHRCANAGEVPAWDENDPGWIPVYSPWRHGGWYVDNVRYPSGAVGCVSRNYPDRKWRIVCDPRDGSYPGGANDHTYPSRDEAARAERALVLAMRENERLRSA